MLLAWISAPVAGRLGHGDGTTTLRHYAAWVSHVDQRAASILSTGLSAGQGRGHADRHDGSRDSE